MENPFDVELFRSGLNTVWLGHEFIHKDEAESTNTLLKKGSADELVHGTVLHTDHQTGGRGQYNRAWYSGARRNLTFTIAFKPEKSDRLPLLTLACAYGISRVLEGYSGESVLLKWPNDLMANGKKLGGILTECIFLGNKPDRVLVGAGINVLKDGYPGMNGDTVTFLEELCDGLASISRERILAESLNTVETVYEQWVRNDPQLYRTVSKRLIGYGKWVEVSLNGIKKEGRFKFLGVNEEGEPIALNEELDVNTFKHGQFRILGGYKGIS